MKFGIHIIPYAALALSFASEFLFMILIFSRRLSAMVSSYSVFMFNTFASGAKSRKPNTAQLTNWLLRVGWTLA